MAATRAQQDNAEVEDGRRSRQSRHPFITRLLQALIPSRWIYSTLHPLPSSRPPRSVSRLIDTIFFTHCFPLLWSSALGRNLTQADFPPLQKDLCIKSKLVLFQSTFFMASRRETIDTPANSTFLLLRTLLWVFRWELVSGLGCRFLDIGISVAQVLLYKTIIEYLLPKYYRSESAYVDRKSQSVGYGVGLLIANGIVILVAHILKARATFTMDLIGGQVRTLLATMIAEKSLETTQWAFEGEQSDSLAMDLANKADTDRQPPLSTGAVLNLANTDVERVQLGFRLFNDVWPSIILLPYVGGLSWWLIGWPGLAAIGFEHSILLCTIPLLFSMYKVRANANIQTDKRVKLVNDLIHGIRLLKACAWEDVYYATMKNVRHGEIVLNKTKIRLSTWLMALSFYSATGAPILGVALYAMNNDIRLVHSANLLCFVFLFVWLAEFYFIFATSVVAVADTWQSLRRIQNFLIHEETLAARDVKHDDTSCIVYSAKSTADESVLTLSMAEFARTRYCIQSTRSGSILKPITLSVQNGELIAITGSTSSGKTTLATCLAGLTFLKKGKLSRQSEPVYSPSSPWIHSGTVRENVLFGQAFRDDVYWEVIKSCQLQRDLTQFPHGDMSYLGERGINLSGGQRTRIGLARAVYACLVQKPTTLLPGDKQSIPAPMEHHIIIMDDPLSALDAATALAVFESVILNKLAKITRILVTHQIQFLEQCDRVIWMDNGQIESVKPFSELVKSNESFRKFIGKKIQMNHTESDGEETRDERLTKFFHDDPDEYVEQEECRTRGTPWIVLGSYFRFRKYWPLYIILAIDYIIAQFGNNIYSFLFAWWTSQKFEWSTGEWLALIGGSIIAQNILWQSTSYATTLPLVSFSEATSNLALKGVLKAPMTFFDRNPSGRILNRFTQDVNSTDNVLPSFLWQLGILGCYSVSIIGIGIYYVHLIASILVPWLALVVLYVSFYRPTPLAVKRIEAPLSSNIIAQISEIVQGAPEIQAFPEAKRLFQEKLYTRVDELNRVHLSSFAIHAWISVYAAVLSSVFYLGVGLLALRLRRTLAPGITSALLVASLNLLWSTQFFLYRLAETQRCINCVERLHHYAYNLEKERDSRIQGTTGEWPTRGEIRFSHINVRYKDSCPLALRDLTFIIAGGSKVGVVGRTGAGKSTLYSLLLGLIDPCGGTLSIDNVDTMKVGLHDLREAIAIIPQEPVLFAGTVRTNLDPTQIYTDDHLDHALQITGLQQQRHQSPRVEVEKETQSSHHQSVLHNLTLNTTISPGGLNLSSGQRQLLSLARALVRNTQIILIDEATAMVDYYTDARIQKLLREEFQERTVVAIAHRLTTVLNYDRIIVMESGSVIEYDTPYALWKERGAFRELCDKAQIVESQFVP